MTSSPVPRTIATARHLLATGDLTAVDLLAEVEARADTHDADLGAYLHRSESAREAAASVDRRRAAGEQLGVLAGIPLAVKDIILTADAPTTAQSRIPAPESTGRDAPVVGRLRAADAVLTGKTSTLEFALAFSDADGPFPTPRNPWHLDHWTGGSSSGTGSGIAAGFFLGGLGTDTAGSIRMPAAWCGVSGHKPTYGLVPRTGVYPLAWSYDHVGPLARTAEDCALLLSVLAGPDAGDHSAADTGFAFTAEPELELRDLRVGLAVEPLTRSSPAIQALMRDAASVFAAAGAEVTEISVPHYDEGMAVTMYGLAAEAFSYHRDDLRTRWHDYSRATRNALLTGALMSGGDYVQVQRLRRHLVARMAEVFSSVDLVLSPTASAPPPRVDNLDFGEVVAMLQTGYWNATGHPALSVPMGLAAGLPAGLQVIGRPFEDTTVLDAGRRYQQLTTHHHLTPDLEGR